MAKQTIQPKSLNDPRPRYSQAILTEGGKLLFIAGQTASDKDGNVAREISKVRHVKYSTI